MPIAGCEKGCEPIQDALESTENLEKEKKNLTVRIDLNETTYIQNPLIYHLTTWEKRSFQRERHIETS